MQSHVIPEFMYRAMYDSKHRFFGFSRKRFDPVLTFQKGLRENLLCRDCEQQFGRYENYAAQFFYGNAGKPVKSEGKHMIWRNAQYARLKLFFLSLLWRFGVTSIEQLSGADLGPHQEKLKKMLLAEDPGDYLVYPCAITAVTWKGSHIADLMIGPGKGRLEGQQIWQFVVAGFVFAFFVSSHAAPSSISTTFLRPNGTLIIGVREITEIPSLHQIARQVADAHLRKR